MGAGTVAGTHFTNAILVPGHRADKDGFFKIQVKSHFKSFIFIDTELSETPKSVLLETEKKVYLWNSQINQKCQNLD